MTPLNPDSRLALLLAALLAVVLHVLAFPPVDAGPLALIALAPWCHLARRLRGWRLFGAGALVGAGILTFGCMWISRTHPMNLLFMVIPESLFFGGFALLLRFLLVTRAWPAVLALPIAFTTIEVVRGRWPLDGFPWLTFGYTQHAWLEIVQLSALAGVHGVTFLLGVTAGALVDAIARTAWRDRLVALAPGALLLLAVVIGGHLALGDPAALPAGPRLLLVQPNLEQRLKMSGALNGNQILSLHFDLTDRVLARAAQEPGHEHADLVVWSETMLPALWPVEGEEHPGDPPLATQSRAVARDLLAARLFRRYSLPLLTGVITYEGAADDPFAGIRNSAILLDVHGRRLATYDKKVLVPGGEYLPWISRFPAGLADDIRHRVYDMAGFLPRCAPGVRSGIIDLAAVGLSGKVGLNICFEFAYPHVGRELVQKGAEFLLNLSNEAWFPDTAEFDQSTAMSVFRAAETRRSLVRCANSGTSGWIDPWGRTALLTKDGRRDGFAGAIVVTPRLASGTTPYVRFGEWVGWSCSALVAAALVLRRRKRIPAAR